MDKTETQKHTGIVDKLSDFVVSASDFLFDMVPNQRIENGQLKNAHYGHNVIAEAGSLINAESGSRVTAESGSSVVARKGAEVTFKSGSFGLVDPGAKYHAEKGSHVIEVSDVTPFLFRKN